MTEAAVCRCSYIKAVLKICSKFTGTHHCRSVISISIKLLCNFIEIALRHGCSPVNLLHIFRTYSFKNISGWLLLKWLETVLLALRMLLVKYCSKFKKVVLFPKIGWVNFFYHSPARIVKCISEYTFFIWRNIKQTNKQTNKKQKNQKKQEKLKRM